MCDGPTAFSMSFSCFSSGYQHRWQCYSNGYCYGLSCSSPSFVMIAYFLLFYYVRRNFFGFVCEWFHFHVCLSIHISFPEIFWLFFIVSLASFFCVRTSSSFTMSSVEGFGDDFVFLWWWWGVGVTFSYFWLLEISAQSRWSFLLLSVITSKRVCGQQL